MVYIQPSCRTTGSLRDWLTWAVPWTRCGGEKRAILFLALSQPPKLKAKVSRGAKHYLSANAVSLFATFLGPVTFSVSKETIRNLSWAPLRILSQIGSAGRWRKFVRIGLGARFGVLKQLRVLAHLVACTERFAPLWFELNSGFGRHARLSSLEQWPIKNG